MPYISEYDRALVDQTGRAVTPGELNYQLTKIINQVLQDKGISYDVINSLVADLELSEGVFKTAIDSYLDDRLYPDTTSRMHQLIGALRCCQMELYRRVAVPYENTKISTNGDVYDV